MANHPNRGKDGGPRTYSNPRMEAVIDGWPIGNKRTTAHFSIECVKGKGERGTRYTIDPKTGKPTATKKLTYASAARIVDGDDGKTYIIERTMYGFVNVMQGNCQFIAESIDIADPRWADCMTMLGAPPSFIERTRNTAITQHA